MNQKILITGASGGFGFLAAKSLIEAGHSVVGTMRSTQGKNEKVAQDLLALGAQIVELDVTDEESVNAGVAKTIELLGGLDVIINNAGLGSTGIQELFSVEDMQRVYDVNVFGVQRVMRAVLPHFRAQGKGTIMHISSCLGRFTSGFYGVYGSSKYALEALAEGYRAELAGFGIESCIVEPGGMPTAFMDSLLRPSDAERATEYGEMANAPEAALEGFHQALMANPKQRPEQVATAIVDLLAKPYGEKPFRTVVDYMGMGEAVGHLNNVSKDITRQIYTAFGNEASLSLNEA
ncbi:MAG: SDR family oxidoreductase [Bacteroidota bacterium]